VYISDSPIETPNDDRYGISGFARAIATSILNLREPVGMVIAVNGVWGSGKTSVINLVRRAIDQAPPAPDQVGLQKPTITDFKCWWFRGEEALVLAFLQHMAGMTKESLGAKAVDAVSNVAKPLLDAAPTLGSALAAGTGNPLWKLASTANVARKLFFSGETVEKAYRKLSDLLAKGNKRFLVIIDDIDRLSPNEAIAIFRLVKSVGCLPNIAYLLAFDRTLAEKVVQEKYPSEGPHFLEKIVQAFFDVPMPSKSDLNSAVLSAIGDVCGEVPVDQQTWMGNVFFDVVSPYITTPRDVARLAGAISVTWPSITNNVNLADFVAMETLRLYEPTLFRALRERREAVTGLRADGDANAHDEARFGPYLTGVPDSRRAQAKTAVRRLFPRLENIGYARDHLDDWDRQRRVCVPRHFETYLRLTLNDETLSADHIDELVRRAGDVEFVKETFRDAARRRRRSGGSFVPVYFDELTPHAVRIQRRDVEPFLRALFAIHDEINLIEDDEKGFWAMANTSLRLHWLMRKLTDALPLEDRSAILVHALADASTGWAVDFARSAWEDYHPARDSAPQPPERCLVLEDTVKPIVTDALAKLRAAAADGTLLRLPRFVFNLYAWRLFSGSDPAEVRAWTDILLRDDQTVLLLMRLLTSQSYAVSMGFVGLGDRVATPRIQVYANDQMDVIDPVAFRSALERILAERRADADILEAVRVFLEAWGRGQR
jgi:predicted KAP-like P-loop ATPase